MENKSWTIIYRNRESGQRVTGTVYAANRAQASEKARADGMTNGREEWEVESVESHEETLARILISEFAKKQRDGHYACPRCGMMTMDAKSVTRNALSRRADVYICDTCGIQEAIEDMTDGRTPLTKWEIVRKPEAWRMNAERRDGNE